MWTVFFRKTQLYGRNVYVEDSYWASSTTGSRLINYKFDAVWSYFTHKQNYFPPSGGRYVGRGSPRVRETCLLAPRRVSLRREIFLVDSSTPCPGTVRPLWRELLLVPVQDLTAYTALWSNPAGSVLFIYRKTTPDGQFKVDNSSL
jgi:hypothetical protein